MHIQQRVLQDEHMARNVSAKQQQRNNYPPVQRVTTTQLPNHHSQQQTTTQLSIESKTHGPHPANGI